MDDSASHFRQNNKAFAIGVGLNLLYIIVEVTAGLMVNSIALLADAGHNASDVFSLLLAWGASYLGQTQPTKRRTYGLGRTSILASLTNAILLLIVIGAIAWEAILRLAMPQPIPGGTLMWVAAVGVIALAEERAEGQAAQSQGSVFEKISPGKICRHGPIIPNRVGFSMRHGKSVVEALPTVAIIYPHSSSGLMIGANLTTW